MGTGLPTALHVLAAVLYGGTAAFAAVPFFPSRRRGSFRVGVLALGLLAVGVHLAALIAYTTESGDLPVGGLGPTLASLALMVALLALGVVWLTGEGTVLLMALPLVIGPIAIALVVGFGVAEATVERGFWFPVHAGASIFGLAALGVAFVAAVLYVVQFRALKERRFGVIFQVFPPLEQLDRLNFVALLAGFPVLTIGIVLAAVTMRREGGVVAERAAHVAWGVLAWVTLGGIAASRGMGWLRGRRAAVVTIVGFGALAVLFAMLRALLGGGARFL